MKTSKYKTLFFVLISCLLTACGGGVTGEANNFIVVKDQDLIDLRQVEITNVTLEKDAWIVIYESVGPQEVQGGQNNVIGLKLMRAGEYDSIKVQIEREIVDGELLFAELREDMGIFGEFEPEGEDAILSQSSVSSVSFLVSYSQEPYLSFEKGTVYDGSLIIEKVISNKKSWLVAYTFAQNAEYNFGNIIGYHKLSVGHHSNVAISLLLGKSTTLDDGDQVVVALHEDTETTGQLDEFDSAADGLITFQGQELKQVRTVDLGSPIGVCNGCIKFEIGPDPVNNYYIWSAEDFNDQTLIKEGESGSDDKTIVLEVGKRYQISNQSPVIHPFKLIGSTGEVLLSQFNEGGGSFANDPEVDFINASGVMTFTLSADLAINLTSYSCQYHGAMTGSFEILP